MLNRNTSTRATPTPLSKRALLCAAWLCAAIISPLAAHAQADYPNKPITLVVPFPAGGANDAVGRLIGQKLAEALKQTVIVDNKPGAGTTLGTAIVAKSAPDGYTLLLGSLASHAVSPHLFAKPGYDAFTDFSPIALMGVAPIILYVNKETPYMDVKSLVAAGKAKPGSLNYGSAGNGSPLHLAGELFAIASGVNMVHVPYKGGSAHTMDLIGGRLDMIFDTATSAMPLIKGDKVRALAVAAPARLAELPNVPTFAEAGYPNFEVSGWYALYAPAKTPADIVARLNAETVKALHSPEVVEKFRGLGVRPMGGTPADLLAFQRAEFDKHGKVIRDGNIKAD